MSYEDRLERRLDRIERKQDHAHELLHTTYAAVLKLGGADDAAVAAQIEKLRASAAALSSAVAANQPEGPVAPDKEQSMANPLLDALAQQVRASTDAEQSAVVLINGFAARMDAAIQAALAGGATAAELQPVQAEVDALHASADALAAAVTANTPAQAQAAKKRP